MCTSSRRMVARVVLSVALVAMLGGCAGILDLFGIKSDSKDPAKTDPPPGPAASVGIYAVIDGLGAKLLAGGIPSGNGQTIVAATADAARRSGYGAEDYENQLPLAVESSVEALGSSGLSAELQTAGVGIVTGHFVAAIEGKFEATGADTRSRSLNSSALAVSALLERISRAAVSSLSKTDIPIAERGAVAGAIVGTMIGSLDDGGINKALVNAALGTITQAAVASLKDAGLSQSEALQVAVKQVAEGAVAAVANIAVAGVETGDYAKLAQTVSQQAAAAVGGLAASVEEVHALVGQVAAGAAQGATQVAASVAGGMDSTAAKALVVGVTSGVTEGALSTALVNASVDGAAIIAQVTAQASQALSTGAASMSLQVGEVLSAVTIGAAAAAQTGQTGLDAQALAAAISLKDASGTTVQIVGGDLDAGIALGANLAPVVAIPPELTATRGDLVTVDAGASYDPDPGDTIGFAWSLASKPSGSTVQVASVDDSVGFSPDRPGAYLLAVKVTDDKGAFTEAFCAVSVIESATSVTYLGKTAAERLAIAQAHYDLMDYPEAIAECESVLGRYPETTATIEASYRIARSYELMQRYQPALARYEELAARWPESEWADWARSRAAGIKTWYIKDYAGARAMLEALLAEYAGSDYEPDILVGLGLLDAADGNRTSAEEKFLAARDNPLASLSARSNAQYRYAESLGNRGDASGAETEMLKLLGDSRFFAEAGVVDAYVLSSSRRRIANLLWNQGSIAERLQFLQDSAQDMNLLPWQRLYFSRQAAGTQLNDFAQTVEQFHDAKTTLESALAGYTLPAGDPEAKIEYLNARLLMGTIYRRLAEKSAANTEKESFRTKARTELAAVKQGAGSKWYALRAKGGAALEDSYIDLWQLADYGAAESSLQGILDWYPTELYDQYPRLLAYLRLGDVWMQRGYKASRSDQLAARVNFQRAAYYYARAKAGDFPGFAANYWPFVEALRKTASAYAEMEEFATAKSLYAAILTRSDIDQRNLAWAQLELANCYGREVRELLYEGKLAELQALGDLTVAEYGKVETYLDGSANPVDQGRPIAEARTKLGLLYWEVGWWFEKELGMPAEQYNQVYLMAEQTLATVRFEDFPGLATTDWYFYDARRYLARAILQLARYAEAAAVYQGILADIDAELFAESKEPDIRYRLADVHRQHGDKTPATAGELGSYLEAKGHYEAAIAEYRQVIALDPALDNGVAAAMSHREAGYCFRQIIERRIKVEDGQAALLADRSAVDAMVSQGRSILGAGIDYRYDGAAPDSGYPSAACVNWLARLERSYAKYLGRSGLWDSEDRKAALRASIAAADRMDGAFMSARWKDAVDSRVSKFHSLLDLAELDDDRRGRYMAAEELWAEIITKEESYSWASPDVTQRMGWFLVYYGDSLVALGVPGIADEAAWRALADFYFTTIIDNDAWRESAEWAYDSAVEGLAWLAANPPAQPAAARSLSRSVAPVRAAPVRAARPETPERDYPVSEPRTTSPLGDTADAGVQ